MRTIDMTPSPFETPSRPASLRLLAAAGMLLFQAASSAAVHPENPPSLLRTFAGKEVKTREEWEKTRAPELLAKFETEEYGRRPAAADEKARVSFDVYDVREAMGGKAVRKLVRATYKGPHGDFSFPFTAYIPKAAKPVPAFILAANIPRATLDEKQALQSRFWPVEEIVARGYATAAFRFDTVAADRKGAGFSQGVFPAVQAEGERDGESWATLSAWAWADSRILDWMETEPLIDAKRVGVVGHSRGGKTAIWAGATDRRFAMVCSNNSGCSGAKLNHIDLPKSEHISRILMNFPYWFCENYRRHAGKEMSMAFDQHQLLALIAPRLLCVASATDDQWAGPEGEWWAAKLASPAWELYGKKGLAADAFPEPGTPQQEGCISYHLRKGKHLLSPYDWKCYLDFADRHGWNVTRAPSDAEPVALAVDRRAESANTGPAPSFSWQMKCDRRGAAQTAYRLTVLEQGGGEMWDSGVVDDSRSVAVKYAGRPLAPARRYVWRVSVKDDRGKWADSAFAHFTTGLFSADDWKGAAWISASGDDAYGRGTACFTKSAVNAKALREAYWTVAGLGVFEAYVNGKPVSSRDLLTDRERRDFLKPGFTHYEKRKHAITYDVTHLMKTEAKASNVFSAEVSASWWRDQMLRRGRKKSAFKARLILRYADGTEESVVTDATWLAAAAGPVKEAGIYEGETYDARVSTPWRTSPKAPAGFAPAETNTVFSGETLPMDGPAISLRRDLALAPREIYVWKGVDGATRDAHGKAKVARRYADGETVSLDAGETLVIDFGQNAAAVPEFVFSAKAGTTLAARPAEMLNDGNGAKKRGCDGPEGSAYFANYRRAKTTLRYVFSGRGAESYHPSFTFFGYRYLSVTATGKVTLLSARSLPVTSIVRGEETGTLETGVAEVDKLVSNVLWGQYSNYLSVPTDCPQRDERQGWTADTQVFTKAASYNADVYGFLCKWLADVRDSQCPDGSIPGIAPVPGPRYDGCRLGWSDAVVIVPYTLWRHFGDLRTVGENWDAMAKYVDLIDRRRFATPKDQSYQWADWLSYEKYETHLPASWTKGADGKRAPRPEVQAYWRYLGGCYRLWDARMMAEMAGATGRADEARKYAGMAERALADLRDAFVSKEDGLLLPAFRDMQTPALFALKLGVVEGAAAQKTRAALLANIKAHGDCLQTGFLGTSILMDTLTYAAGAPEVAYTLLLQHKNPSWLYSVDQGATTIWERWNSYTKASGFGSAGMNSFNHYAYGAVVAWMYGTMAGIREDPESGGFKRFVLAPLPDRRMKHVSARYRSPYGEIRSEWRYEGDTWYWSITIPANTAARVTVPGGEEKEYTSGTYIFSVPQTLTVAERGRPAGYAIVLPEKPDATEQYAAEELRDHVRKMTDVELPIAGAPVPGRKSVFLRRTVIDGPFPDDAFRVKAAGDDLHITGGKRGVLYGVYEILETYGGCKWYASWHSVIPKRERFSVPADIDDEQRPAFAMRQPFWYDVNKNRDFAARIRVNGYNHTAGPVDAKYGGDDFRFGGGLGSCHTFEALLPQSVYFDKHPEYYSLVKGKRLKGRTQLCLTNPDVLRIVTSNVLERIRKDPGAKFYGVSQNDWYNYCECETCAAVDKEEESHAGTMVRFVNAVAEAVEKEFPDAVIETLAYQYTRKPPKKTRLRHNVMPCLCTIECDFTRPIPENPYEENRKFLADINGWKTQTSQLYLWDYTTEYQNFALPFPNVYALQGNIQFFRENNVKELFEQGDQCGRHGAFAELKAWLLAKFMWNPDRPLKPLLDDFFAGYYGKAAPFVREYFEEVHRRVRAWSPEKGPMRIWRSEPFRALDDGFVAWAKPLWDKAEASVKDAPSFSYNTRMSKFSFDFLRLEKTRRRAQRLFSFVTGGPVDDSAKLKEIQALAKSMLARMDEAKNISLSESRGRHDALVEQWRKFVSSSPAKYECEKLGVVEDKYIGLSKEGTWGARVDDPLAEDGKALKLFNNHFEWCANLRMGAIDFKPGTAYKLRARIRVEKLRDGGEAFWTGVYDDASRKGLASLQPRTESIEGEGYRWYDVCTWTPRADGKEYFWIGPGRFGPDGKTNIKAVFLDKIEITAVERQEGE